MWHSRLNEELEKIGFVSCRSEPCVYTKNNNKCLNIIAVYVDDLLLVCTDLGELGAIIKKISNVFQIVNKGPINHFLGMEVERENPTGALTISQKQLVLQLLKKNRMSVCRPVSTPLETNFQVHC
ncbi:uncharacterized mitochondrial protein AtMg00810-like [Teleopsis dalmanni]|uniref:uncharacterized mitochondrial protein AtMg00810-like n=1 Tax=Teleopsis dalmanni TaxID=139649 RepID=UPI0018CE6F23|nr:uncharacterized mitochondrial protein AtMg00810-like [Teleopsis dalmanni]